MSRKKTLEGEIYTELCNQDTNSPFDGYTIEPASTKHQVDSVSSGMKALECSSVVDDPPEVRASLCCPTTLSCCISCLLPFSWLGGIKQINEREAALVLTWGKFTTVMKTPGLFCVNPVGVEFTTVSLKQRTTDLPNVKLLDLKGNPVVVSGVVFWQIHSVKASILNVENVYQYVHTTAMAVLKQVVSKYPYEDDGEGHSLKTEAAAVGHEMSSVLQDRLAHAGVKVIAFNMTDLSYAPEIAQAMLVRQQAEAMIKARRLIVKGAVDISQGAITQLQEKGIEMDNQEKTKIVSNLLTVICGEQGAQPTVALN